MISRDVNAVEKMIILSREYANMSTLCGLDIVGSSTYGY